MADSIQVNVRYSNVLLARIDAAAGEGKRSEWILEACRMRLDTVGDSSAADVKTVNAGVASLPSTPHAGSNPDHSAKSTMQDLRDICAGKIVKSSYEGLDGAHGEEKSKHTPTQIEIPICGKDWWEDGEHYECLMDHGHREQKHGMRGMVRRLDA